MYKPVFTEVTLPSPLPSLGGRGVHPPPPPPEAEHWNTAGQVSCPWG